MFKFRTMREGSGTFMDMVLPGDDRITVIGRFLRSTHLDELPQLWNVIRGDMSLVGPRPITPGWFFTWDEEIPNYRARFDVLPGITGVIQIRRRTEAEYSPVEVEKNLLLDLCYIRHRSLLLDLKILLQTIPAVIKRRGV